MRRQLGIRMSNWADFKTFINNNGGEDAIFSRIGIQGALPHIGRGTLDGYRSLLQKAGFFEFSGRGQDRLVKKIPTDITWDECQMLIGHKNLDYMESVHRRKQKKAKRDNNTVDKEIHHIL